MTSQDFQLLYGNLGIYNTITPQVGALRVSELSSVGNLANDPNNPTAIFKDANIIGGTLVTTDASLADIRLNTLYKKGVFIGSVVDVLTTNTPGAGDLVTRFITFNRITCANNGNQVYFYPNYNSGDATDGAFATDTEIITKAKFSNTTNQDACLIVGATVGIPVNAVNTDWHFGFLIQDGTIWASNGDGAAQKTTDVSAGITLTNYNTYRAVHTVGSKIEYYINDILVVTHTTNLPSTTNNFQFQFGISKVAPSGVSQKLTVATNYTIIKPYV